MFERIKAHSPQPERSDAVSDCFQLPASLTEYVESSKDAMMCRFTQALKADSDRAIQLQRATDEVNRLMGELKTRRSHANEIQEGSPSGSDGGDTPLKSAQEGSRALDARKDCSTNASAGTQTEPQSPPEVTKTKDPQHSDEEDTRRSDFRKRERYGNTKIRDLIIKGGEIEGLRSETHTSTKEQDDECTGLPTNLENVSRAHSELQSGIYALMKGYAKLNTDLENATQYNLELPSKYNALNEENAKLQTKLEEARQDYLRVRTLLVKRPKRVFGYLRSRPRCEQDKGEIMEQVLYPPDADNEDYWGVQFNHIFDLGVDNKSIYDQVKPIVQDFLNGCIVAILVDGPCGSGKTHTMLNPDDGVAYLAIEQTFKHIDTYTRKEGSNPLTISFLCKMVYLDDIIFYTWSDNEERGKGREDTPRELSNKDELVNLMAVIRQTLDTNKTTRNPECPHGCPVYQLTLTDTTVEDFPTVSRLSMIDFADVAAAKASKTDSNINLNQEEQQLFNNAQINFFKLLREVWKEAALSPKRTKS